MLTFYELMVKIISTLGAFVRVTEQNLEEDQKARARENIDAARQSDLSEMSDQVNSMKTDLDTIKESPAKNAVLYTAQELTEEQKAQTRENIGAPADSVVVKTVNGETPDENGNVVVSGSGGGSAEGAVLYTAQELTEDQKAQARENVGAADAIRADALFSEVYPTVYPAPEYYVGGYYSLSNGVLTEKSSRFCIRTANPIAIPAGAKVYLSDSTDYLANVHHSTDNGVSYSEKTIGGSTKVFTSASDCIIHVSVQPRVWSGDSATIALANLICIDLPNTYNTKFSNVDVQINDVRVVAEKAYTRMPIVTFIDDDGYDEALDNWEAIADETGICPSMAIVTGRVGSDSMANWDKIKKLDNRGFEFISHFHTHTNMTTLSATELETGLHDTITAFRENGMKAEFLAYPGNNVDGTIIPVVRKYFKGAVYGGNAVNYPPVNHWNLRRWDVCNGTTITITNDDGTTSEVNGLRTLEELKTIVNEAITNCGWVIFMTHFRNQGGFYFNDDVKQLTVDIIQYAVESGCKVVTLGEGFSEYKNRLHYGTRFDDSYNLIGCDGTQNKYNMT